MARGQHGVVVEAEMRQRQQRYAGARHQHQHRLDHLHPGGGHHAAEHDVDDHQPAHRQLRVDVVDPEQQLHQLPGADHLRHQENDHHGERRHRGQRPHRRLGQARGEDVGEGELAHVAHLVGEQQHDDRAADAVAGREHQPVVAGAEHQAGEPEEGAGRDRVARDRQPVLQHRHLAAGRVEVPRRAGAPGRPPGDAQGQQHQGEEHGDGRDVQAGGLARLGVGSPARHRQQPGPDQRHAGHAAGLPVGEHDVDDGEQDGPEDQAEPVGEPDAHRLARKQRPGQRRRVEGGEAEEPEHRHAQQHRQQDAEPRRPGIGRPCSAHAADLRHEAGRRARQGRIGIVGWLRARSRGRMQSAPCGQSSVRLRAALP